LRFAGLRFAGLRAAAFFGAGTAGSLIGPIIASRDPDRATGLSIPPRPSVMLV
jgi:hypothetical protein